MSVASTERAAFHVASASRAALFLIALLTAFRLLYGANAGMTNDETHYWQWSRHLDLSYFDQGPGIAYCIRLGTLLFGHTPLGVRFIPILLAAGTGWLIFATARRWFGDQIALWTLGLLSIAPLLAAGGLLANYDNPQVFCWSAAQYFLTRTVQEDRPTLWYAVGFFVGLGALCKLTMVLFAPCALVFLLLIPEYRRHLATPHPWLAFLLALIIFSPVLYWNATHEWSMFQHAAALNSRSLGAPPFRWFGEFLGGQAIVLSPFLFLAELWVLGRAGVREAGNRGPGSGVRGGVGDRIRAESTSPQHSTPNTQHFPPDPGPRTPIPGSNAFTFAFGALILFLCLIISLRSKMEANWPAPAHLAGVMAVAAWFDSLWQTKRILPRVGIVASAVLSVVMVTILLFPGVVPAVGIRVSAELAQKANETYGWGPLMQEVQAVRTRLEAEGKPVFLAGINYRVPSLLAFHLPDHPETKELFFATRRDQYYFWTKPETLVGQNALLCLDDDKREAVELAHRYFARVETLPLVIVQRPGFEGNVKRWFLYACYDFKGYDPTAHVKGY